MATVDLNNQQVRIEGVPGSLSLSENFGLFGNQGFTISSLKEAEELFKALSTELPKAWPGVVLTLTVPKGE